MIKKFISVLSDGMLSGLFLCMGCAVSMSAPSQMLGAFMFSLGLFAIITLRLALFTGKAGYLATKGPAYIVDVIFTLLGNAVGVCIGGSLLNLTRFGVALSEKASTILEPKFADTPLSAFILAVMCGILMFTAVHGYRRNCDNGNYIGAMFIVVLPVMVFITCGFNHCVADMAYFFISRCNNTGGAVRYFPLAILGNVVGCVIIPLVKKLSEKRI